MERIKEEDIPDALLKWINDESDIWLFRYTRSIGYTFEEIVKLAKKNEKINHVLDFITESILEKTIYRVAEGSFNYQLAFYFFDTYLNRLYNFSIKKRNGIPPGDKDYYNDSDNDDDDENFFYDDDNNKIIINNEN